MTLRNVRRATLAEKVARELERMIVSGEWAEGTRIPPEPDLVKQLGVSRNTVREAVRALAHAGLLEARPGDGTYVRSASLLGASLARRLENCGLREILEVRHSLEREAARLAASRRTPEDVETLRREFEIIRTTFHQGGPAETIVQLIFDHHLTIVRAGRNPLLVELYESIEEPVRASIEALLEVFDALESELEPAERLHRELVDAIDAGDAESAARLVSEHATLIQGWLEQEEELDA